MMGPMCPADGSAEAARVATLANRLTQLARVASELVRADTVESVSKTVVMHGASAVGARLGTMTLLDDDGQTVRLLGFTDGALTIDAESADTFPLTAKAPSAEAIRTGERRMVAGEHAVLERYPEMRNLGWPTHAVVSLPLHSGARTIGAISLVFSEPRELDAAEVEFLDILADTCAQTLDRISARNVAARQSAKLAFLATAAQELASSLDYEVTLANVARLAVPTFADWCGIDVVADDQLRRLAVEHVDPAKVQMARELAERYPADPDAEHGAWQVMRTGRSELIADITDEMLVAGAVDDEHLRIARALQLRSALTVPLVARGRVRGVLTWVTAESGRRYTAEDVALAEEVARHAAVCLDNAELHSQTLAAASELQHAVLPQTLPSSAQWEVGHYYHPSGRTEVGGDFYDVIDLGEGRLAMFVGDVMGRGVMAAAAMAQMRAAVRAYAALDPTPETVLTRLDEMYARYQGEQLVTLVYLLADPAHDRLLVGNAGHPPPVVLRGDGAPLQLPFADGGPLGVVEHESRAQQEVELGVGDTVVLFTDGLIERRGEDITDGLARLMDAVGRLTGSDLAAALPDLVAEVRDPSRDDDVAVLAVRRRC